MVSLRKTSDAGVAAALIHAATRIEIEPGAIRFLLFARCRRRQCTDCGLSRLQRFARCSDVDRPRRSLALHDEKTSALIRSAVVGEETLGVDQVAAVNGADASGA